MESELVRLKDMNEKLFKSSANIEQKLEAATQENHILTTANEEFQRARETQAK